MYCEYLNAALAYGLRPLLHALRLLMAFGHYCMRFAYLWSAATAVCTSLAYGLRPLLYALRLLMAFGHYCMHFVYIKHSLRSPASMLGMTDHPWSASHFFKRRQSNQKVSCSNKLSNPLTAAPFLSYRREETSL
ncbi:hypothetical protein Glaag_4105 [Glaciecola sp. 4H-3-7+YE-5]|nr:hypothetical protein Glaag_4105 [Glaciecola sp. 4H-3-7+YE-5]